MRGQARVVCLALLLAVLGAADGDAGGDAAGDEAAKGEESGAETDDFDFDDDVEADDDLEAGAGAQGQAAVEDFDLAMPPEDQKVRMGVCFGHTMKRVRARQEELQASMKEAIAQQPQLTQEQVLNSIVFSWMMSCYMNIDNEGIKPGAQSQPLTPEMETELFTERPDRPQQFRQASRRQWQLLEQTVAEIGQEQQKQQKDQPRPQKDSPQQSAGASLPLSGMSGQSAALYILVVFGVVFGFGAIVIYRLSSNPEKGGREKSSSSKSQKKAEKAEKKLAKKKM